MKLRLVWGIACLVLVLAATRPATAITYLFNDTVGTGTVTGTVTTDGTLGALTPLNFVSWNLTIANKLCLRPIPTVIRRFSSKGAVLPPATLVCFSISLQQTSHISISTLSLTTAGPVCFV